MGLSSKERSGTGKKDPKTGEHLGENSCAVMKVGIKNDAGQKGRENSGVGGGGKMNTRLQWVLGSVSEQR